jgi:hypothetical protein
VKPGAGLGGAYTLGAMLGMSAKRGHSRHGNSEVLRARQGRQEANIYIEGRYAYR